jgi:hypothetical protein
MSIVNDTSGTNQSLISITIPNLIAYGDVFSINVNTSDLSTPIVVSTSDSSIFSINSSNNEITVIKLGSASLTVTQGSESITTSNLSVGKKDLYVDVNSKSMVYGSNSPSFNSSFSGFVFNETSMGLTGNFLYVVTDVSSNVISSSNLPTSNVGTYTITVSMGTISSLKYNIIINNSTASLTITKKTLTINAINASMNYGDSVPDLVSYDGFVNGDSSSSSLINNLSYSTIFSSSSNAGSNNFTISIGSLSSLNYNISIGVSSAILTIDALTPVLSIANTTYVYGNISYLTNVSSTYNSTTVSGSFELRLNNSTGTILTTSNYIPVGSNTIYVKFTPTSSNYSITSTTFNLTITKIGPILSYTPSTQSYNYGDSLTSGNLNATSNVSGSFSYTYTLNSNSSVTGPALSTTKLNVGVYTLTATFVPSDTSIYDSSSSITFSTLTVNKVDLTVSISTNPVRFFYDLNVPQSISYSYSGFVNSETVSIFSGQSPDFQVSSNNPQTTLITKANLAGSPVGNNYFINATQGTLASNNYNFVFGLVRNCSIDKANPTVTISIAQNLRTFDYGTALTSDYFNYTITVKDVNNNDVPIQATIVYYDFYRGNTITTGYIFNAGNQGITASINPTDTTKYNGTWSNSIFLTVNKITPTITYTIPSNLKTINYGTALVSSQLSAVVTYNGVNVSVGTITYKPNSTSSSTNYSTSSYPTIDVTKIYAVFNDSNYNSVSTFDTITVNKINATLTWIYPNLQNIAYGRILSNYQLCAQTYNDPNNSAPGIINYRLSSNNSSISLGQILDAETHNFKAILIVTNPNYISETLMIENTLTIVKNIPSITWANPRDVVVGTALSSTQLNAIVSVSNAVCTYTPASGTTISQTGPIELNVLATYNNSNFLFDSISTKVKLNVNN